MTDADDIENLARDVRVKVASASTADDIRGLADRAIEEINKIADEAVNKAQQVDHLMQRLAELLENDDAQP